MTSTTAYKEYHNELDEKTREIHRNVFLSLKPLGLVTHASKPPTVRARNALFLMRTDGCLPIPPGGHGSSSGPGLHHSNSMRGEIRGRDSAASVSKSGKKHISHSYHSFAFVFNKTCGGKERYLLRIFVFALEVGTRWSLRFLATQACLWFCDLAFSLHYVVLNGKFKGKMSFGIKTSVSQQSKLFPGVTFIELCQELIWLSQERIKKKTANSWRSEVSYLTVILICNSFKIHPSLKGL